MSSARISVNFDNLTLMRTRVVCDEMNAEEKGTRLLRIWGIYSLAAIRASLASLLVRICSARTRGVAFYKSLHCSPRERSATPLWKRKDCNFTMGWEIDRRSHRFEPLTGDRGRATLPVHCVREFELYTS